MIMEENEIQEENVDKDKYYRIELKFMEGNGYVITRSINKITPVELIGILNIEIMNIFKLHVNNEIIA